MTEQATRSELTALISSIIKRNKSKTRTAHEALFHDLILQKGYENYLDAALHLIFQIEYIRAFKAVFPPTAAELAAAASDRKKRYIEEDKEVEIAKCLITGRLLDLVTALGKPLRDCTGAECVLQGGFFMAIGQRIGKEDIVGEVLTEKDLQSMARKIWAVDKFRPYYSTSGSATA